MSRLNVDKITGATGTASGAPITLSGDTATLWSSVKVVSAIDTFHITTATIDNTVTYIAFAAATDAFYAPVDGIVTVDGSGVFSFTRAGVYEVNYQIVFDDSDTENQFLLQGFFTTDGSTPDNTDGLFFSSEDSKDTTHYTMSSVFKLNISSTSTKIRFRLGTASTTQSISRAQDYGSPSNLLVSYFQFTQLVNSV